MAAGSFEARHAEVFDGVRGGVYCVCHFFFCEQGEKWDEADWALAVCSVRLDYVDKGDEERQTEVVERGELVFGDGWKRFD